MKVVSKIVYKTTNYLCYMTYQIPLPFTYQSYSNGIYYGCQLKEIRRLIDVNESERQQLGLKRSTIRTIVNPEIHSIIPKIKQIDRKFEFTIDSQYGQITHYWSDQLTGELHLQWVMIISSEPFPKY